jgi:HEAT repeat protein
MRIWVFPVVIGLMLVSNSPQARAGDDELKTLVGFLTSKSPQKRRLAAEALGKRGPKAEAAIAPLVEALADDDAAVKREAATALYRIGTKAVPALGKAMQFPLIEVKLRAATLLRRFGPAAKDVAPDLAAALKDVDVDVRIHAAEALRAIGPPAKEALPALLTACKDLSNLGLGSRPRLAMGVCDAAIQAVKVIDPARLDDAAKEALPALMAALRDKDAGTVLAALDALPTYGPRAKAAIPDLKKWCEHDNWQPRSRAARALRAMGGDGTKALLETIHNAKVPADTRAALVRDLGRLGAAETDPPLDELRALLKDKQPAIRRAAIDALGWLGTRASTAIAELVATFADEALLKVPSPDATDADPFAAPRALARIGQAAVPALAKALGDKNALVRWQAAKALAQLGRRAKGAVTELEKAQEDMLAVVVIESAVALIRAGAAAEQPLEKLAENFEHPSAYIKTQTLKAVATLGPRAASLAPKVAKLLDDKEVWPAAVEALQKMGSEGGRAVPKLVKVLENPKDPSRLAALRSLADLGPLASDAVPALIKGLKEKEAAVARVAAQALGNIGPEANPAVADLLATMDRDPLLGGVCLEALGKIGPKARDAVPIAIKWLTRESPFDRIRAARALGQIGPEAKKALPALEDLRQDPEPAVRAWAIFAIGRITGALNNAVDELIALSPAPTDEDWLEYGGAAVVEAMKELGPVSKKMVPPLIAAARRPGADVAVQALEAVGAFGADGAEAVPALVELLSHRYAPLRASAAEALGRIGPAAKAAVPRLTELLSDENEVADAAEEALARIAEKKSHP